MKKHASLASKGTHIPFTEAQQLLFLSVSQHRIDLAYSFLRDQKCEFWARLSRLSEVDSKISNKEQYPKFSIKIRAFFFRRACSERAVIQYVWWGICYRQSGLQTIAFSYSVIRVPIAIQAGMHSFLASRRCAKSSLTCEKCGTECKNTSNRAKHESKCAAGSPSVSASPTTCTISWKTIATLNTAPDIPQNDSSRWQWAASIWPCVYRNWRNWILECSILNCIRI